MTTLSKTLSFVSLGAFLAACSSPSPSTSSSSHWVTCRGIDDCSALPEAVACTSGYCVDGSGSRIEVVPAHPSPLGDGGDPAGNLSCDPFAPHELPITLGNVFGVGKAPDGTTYMADEITSPSTVDRVFVSDGNVLLRRRSSGAGSNGGPPGPALYSFSFENGDMQLALLLATEMGRATAMGLGPAGTKGFIGDPGAVTTELTVEDPKVLSDFTLKNLNGDVTIELVGDVADGSEIVVTRPTDDWSYEDFRLFSGSGGSLAERRVINTVRTKNGDTIIEFESENGVATASFTWVFDPNTMSHPGPGNIRGAGPEQTMAQRFPTPTTLPGTSFSCLR